MKTFKQTSDKLYDRHLYKIGKHVVSSWAEAVEVWRLTGGVIEVLDHPKKKKGGGGF